MLRVYLVSLPGQILGWVTVKPFNNQRIAKRKTFLVSFWSCKPSETQGNCLPPRDRCTSRFMTKPIQINLGVRQSFQRPVKLRKYYNRFHFVKKKLSMNLPETYLSNERLLVNVFGHIFTDWLALTILELVITVDVTLHGEGPAAKRGRLSSISSCIKIAQKSIINADNYPRSLPASK